MENYFEKKDIIYEALADGHHGIVAEIEHRACITYPHVSELVLVTIQRYQNNRLNSLNNIKHWLENTLDGFASKNPGLEFELDNAYNNGLSKEQIIDNVLIDLMKTQDDGMSKHKYEPLIRFENDLVFLTSESEKLFD